MSNICSTKSSNCISEPINWVAGIQKACSWLVTHSSSESSQKKITSLFWPAFSSSAPRRVNTISCPAAYHVLPISFMCQCIFQHFFLPSHSRPTNCGCDFLPPPPKSPCGLKSNLSDFTYDGLKQVSVFKALKVTWEKWTACTDHTLRLVCALQCTIQRHVIVMTIRRAEWSVLRCMKVDDVLVCIPFLLFVLMREFCFSVLSDVILHAKV